MQSDAEEKTSIVRSARLYVHFNTHTLRKKMFTVGINLFIFKNEKNLDEKKGKKKLLSQSILSIFLRKKK